jgi:hypothetical protein
VTLATRQAFRHQKAHTMSESERTTRSMQCERDRLLVWLRDVLTEGVKVRIVVEEAAGARSSVQITLHDVPGPLAGLDLRPLA